jgi:hypothetical protein
MDENEIAILKEENSTLKKVITILIEQNEVLKAEIAIANNGNVSNNSTSAVSTIGIGNNNSTLAISTNGNGNTEIPHVLPSFLPIDLRNKTRLYVLLKKEVLGKVKNSSVWSAVSLLLHFHNKGAGDYTELRKLTGLSNFGLAKYLRSLKKRGLIERDGWQKFKLTAHAVDLLVKAKCEAGI